MKFFKFHKKSSVLKTLYNRVADLQAKFIKKRDSNTGFPVEFTKFLKTYNLSSEDEDEERLQDVFIKTNVCWVNIHKYLMTKYNIK